MIFPLRCMSIKIKLTLTYTLLFVMTMLLLDFGIFFAARMYLYNKADENMDTAEKMTSELLRVGDTTDRYSRFYANDNLYLRVFDEKGNRIYSSQGFIYSLEFDPNDLNYHHVNNEDHSLFVQTFRIRSENGAVYFLQIVKDMYSENEFLRLIIIVMTGMYIVGMIFAVLLGYFFSKQMLEPLNRITQAAANISSNNLQERIELNGSNDELQQLSRTYNNMLDRIQEAFTKQTQFISFASHELRTPLAVIHGYVNLLDRWGKQDEKILQEAIDSIKLEADNMEKLTERLLFLARMESGTGVLNRKFCVIDPIIRESIEDARLIDEKHIYILGGRSNVRGSVDAGMLKQLLRIFLENARKFTPENGYISIYSWRENHGVKIMVRDTGIGIPEDAIGNIFDRFYTVDQSHEKNSSGNGLGLTMAQMIVNLHGGTVEVRSTLEVGSEFTCYFPDIADEEEKAEASQAEENVEFPLIWEGGRKP